MKVFLKSEYHFISQMVMRDGPMMMMVMSDDISAVERVAFTTNSSYLILQQTLANIWEEGGVSKMIFFNLTKEKPFGLVRLLNSIIQARCC